MNTENKQPLWIDKDKDGSVTMTWARKEYRFWIMVTPGGNDSDTNGWGILYKCADDNADMITDFGHLSDEMYDVLIKDVSQWEIEEYED